MSRFVLCACCALVGAPVSAEVVTITEGHYDRLNVGVGKELHLLGGTVDFLNVVGGVAIIDGGFLTADVFDERSRVGRGGTVRFLGSNMQGRTGDGGSVQYLDTMANQPGDSSINSIYFEGLQFRVLQPSRTILSSTPIQIEGLLLDGNFLRMTIYAKGSPDFYHIEFTTHPGDFDPDGDWDFDINDLNLIRNNFGSPGDFEAGDIDHNGLIDIADLNVVRNRFGDGFQMPSDLTFSGVLTLPPPEANEFVPEPSTIALAATTLLIAAAWYQKSCRWPYWPR